MSPPARSMLVMAVAVFATMGGHAAYARAGESPVDPKMAGHWTGEAEIFVNWTRQRRLAVDIVIASDATVSGRVGDARLSDARLKPNRGELGRALNLATDWIIAGDLSGEIIAAEGVRRAAVKMPLNWSDGLFTGGINTSGSAFGGKKSMVIAAGRMTLRLAN